MEQKPSDDHLSRYERESKAFHDAIFTAEDIEHYQDYLTGKPDSYPFAKKLISSLMAVGLNIKEGDEYLKQKVLKAAELEIVHFKKHAIGERLLTALVSAEQGKVETVSAILEGRPVSRETLTAMAIARLEKAAKMDREGNLKVLSMIDDDDEGNTSSIANTLVNFKMEEREDLENAASVFLARAIAIGMNNKWNSPEFTPKNPVPRDAPEN